MDLTLQGTGADGRWYRVSTMDRLALGTILLAMACRSSEPSSQPTRAPEDIEARANEIKGRLAAECKAGDEGACRRLHASPAAENADDTQQPVVSVETAGSMWWCFVAERKDGETHDHCLRSAAECEAIVPKARADDRFVADSARCTEQPLAHCMTTPGGATYCMSDPGRCDRAFKHSVAAVSGWWGAATACTILRPEDTMPTTEPEPAFAGGDCVIAKDGYIWKIARVENGEYFSLGWQGNAWGNEVSFGIGHFEALGYKRTECPERRF